jgi:hypothetical protein
MDGMIALAMEIDLSSADSTTEVIFCQGEKLAEEAQPRLPVPHRKEGIYI